jgi:hypothetical protein
VLGVNLNIPETLSQMRARAGRIGGRVLRFGSEAARFARMVNREGLVVEHVGTPCWDWTGAIGSDGYGKFRLHGRQRQASAVAWELEHGAPSSEQRVLHRCDRPVCVRPDHLFLGTALDNAADRDAKGRQGDFKGASNGNAKLTPETVLAIRTALAQGEPRTVVAARFDLTPSYVYQIGKRTAWAHLPDPATTGDMT